MEHYTDKYGTWVLVPKDYMLVCEGDPLDMSRVASVTIEPVRLSSTAQQLVRGVRSYSNLSRRASPSCDEAPWSSIRRCSISFKPGFESIEELSVTSELEPPREKRKHASHSQGHHETTRCSQEHLTVSIHVISFVAGLLAMAFAGVLAKFAI